MIMDSEYIAVIVIDALLYRLRSSYKSFAAWRHTAITLICLNVSNEGISGDIAKGILTTPAVADKGSILIQKRKRK